VRVAQDAFGGFPAQAGVGDADAVFQISVVFRHGLAAFIQKAFEHQPGQGRVAAGALRDDVASHFFLLGVLLVRIRMTAIDHDRRLAAGFFQGAHRFRNAFRIVVRASAAAAQDDVAMRIPLRAHDRGESILVNAQERMRRARSLHRVESNLHAAVCPVLETNWHGKATGHFTVRLRFRCAGTNGSPAYEVTDVLRDNGVEKFSRGGHALFIDGKEKATGGANAVLDIVASVQVRIVDQPFPSDRCARFFEINAHHDKQFVLHLVADLEQSIGILDGRLGIVNGAGANNDEKPGIFPAQNAFYRFAPFNDGAVGGFGHGQLRLDSPWRLQPDRFGDVKILCRQHGGTILQPFPQESSLGTSISGEPF
jgi:hypothetical protein